MEHYKALLMYTISNDEVRERLKELLVKNCFEPLNEQSAYGLPINRTVDALGQGLNTTLIVSPETVNMNGIVLDNSWVK